MKVKNKLYIVTLLLSLLLSIGAVVASDNMTFEQSDIQTVSSDDEPLILEKINEDDEIYANYNKNSQLKENSHTVDGDNFTSIQKVIDESSENDIIYLNGKTYTGLGECININTNNLTIIGGSESNPNAIATLDANSLTNIIEINRATNIIIKGIKFINGNAEYGGAIHWYGLKGQISNCSFINNFGTYGGGIYCQMNHFIMDNCSFVNNTSKNTGGGISLYGYDSHATNCYFINNTSDFGGAIFCLWSGNITNSTFINNTATTTAGALRTGSHSIVENNKFYNNSAKTGGAIRLYDDYGSIIDNSFENNVAYEEGSVIWIDGTNDQIISNYINNDNSNTSTIYIVSLNHNLTFKDNNITNTENLFGGHSAVIELNDTYIDFTGNILLIPIYVYDVVENPLTGNVTIENYGTQSLINGETIFKITLPSYPTTLNLTVKYENYTKKISIMVLNHSILNISQSNSSDAINIELTQGATGIVMVTINGKNYASRVINNSVVINIDDLINGNYIATVYYSGDYNNYPEEQTVNITVKNNPVYKITNNKDIAVLYTGKAYYQVLIIKDGEAVSAGEIVTINFNGKNINVKTDLKGYATLKIDTNLKLGTYTIKAAYNAETVSNKITIKQIIKASNKKVKKSAKVSKVKITLSKIDGKILKGKTLKIKFNKKTYKVKTNKKGVAIWKVKKSMLKKIKAGKKVNYNVAYGKDTITKKLIIKK